MIDQANLFAEYRNIVLITIVLYFAGTLFLGYIGRAKKSDQGGEMKDWAVAGRNIGAIVLGLAWSATYFSSYAVLGVSGQAYTEGLAVLNLSVAYFVPTACIMYLLGGAVNILGRQNNYISVGDLLEDRYGTKWARLPIIITTLVFSAYYVGIQLIGAAVVLNQLADVPYALALCLGSIVLCIYVFMGGFKSTALTDTLQAILLFIALFGGGLIALAMTKGRLFSLLYECAGVDAFTTPGLKGLATPRFGLSYNVNIILYCFGYMFIQWMLAADSPGTLKRAAGIYGIVCPAGYIFGSVLLGVAGLAMGIHVVKPDHIFPIIAVQFFGPVVGAVLVAGVLGATQSTAASVLAGVSLCTSHDLYRSMINPDASDKRVLILSRTLSVLILIGSIILALISKEGIMLLGAIGISFFSVSAPVIICALFWPRSTKQAAIVSPFIGLAVLCFTIFVKKNFMGVHPGCWGVVSSALAMIIISCMTEKSSGDAIERIHGTVCRIYGKKMASLWFPTKPVNIFAAGVQIIQMFAVAYGLKHIRSTTLILGMAPQYLWAVSWWIISLISMWVLFKNTEINEPGRIK